MAGKHLWDLPFRPPAGVADVISDETGADGIIPMNTLPDDYYFHDEKRQALIGRRTKKVYQLAQKVTVKLSQADRLTGSMALTLVEEGETTPLTETKNRKPNRRRNRR